MNKLPTFGRDTVDRKGRLARHNIRNVEEYKAAIRRNPQPYLTKAQKDALLRSPQIPHFDREYQSPLGGGVW